MGNSKGHDLESTANTLQGLGRLSPNMFKNVTYIRDINDDCPKILRNYG